MFVNNIPIQLQASIVLLLAQLSFSGWHILGSVAFRDGADPLIFCAYRIILGTSLMHIYVWFYDLSASIDTADYARFVSLGILSFVSMILTALCLIYIGPARFAIFQPSIPCIVAGLSMLVGLEKLNRTKLLGIVVAVMGAFLAEVWKFQANQEKELNVSLGSGLAIGQVLCMGMLLVGVKPLLSKYQPAFVSCVYFSVATVATVLLCIARIDLFPQGAFNFNGETMPWFALVYAAVFTTLFAFSALSWGGKYLNPSVATAFFTFQPVGTIVLSALILGSVVTVPEIVGGLLIVVGLTITCTATLHEDSRTAEDGGSAATSLEEFKETNEACMLRSNSMSVNHSMKITSCALTASSNNSPRPHSSIELLKAAYRNQSALLGARHSSGYTYQPVHTEDSASIADLEQGIVDRTVSLTIHNPGCAEQDYIQMDEYSRILPPEQLISVGSIKGHSTPIRQRSVTIDSPGSATATAAISPSTSNALIYKKLESSLRRNQFSFTA